MKTWKKILIETGIFVSVFALGVGAGFLACYKKKVEPVVETPVVVAKEDTPTEKFLNNLVNAKAIAGDIDLSIVPVKETNEEPLPTRAFDDFNVNNISVGISNLQISLENLEDIKVSCDINLKVESLKLDLNIGYFDNTIFLDYLDTKLFLKTDDITDVMDMLPTFGVNFELPEEFQNLDYDALINSLSNMEEFIEGNEHYFLFNFSEDIQVKFLSNENYEMVGVELPATQLLGMEISATSTLNCQDEPQEMVAPDINEYIEFKPAFSLVDHVIDLVSAKKAHVGVDLDVFEQGENGYQDFFTIDGEVDFDINEQQVFASLLVNEHQRKHTIKAAYLDKTVFVSYKDINVSIENQSIQYLVEYISNKIPNNQMEGVMNNLSSLIGEMDMETIFGYVNDLPNIISNFSLSSNNLSLTFNSDYFELPVSPFSISIDFDENNITSVTITDLEFSSYKINVSLTLSEYKDINIDKAKFVAIDPALSLIETVESLIHQNQFGVRFSIFTEDGDEATKDIDLSGQFYFNLEDKQVEKENENGETELVNTKGFVNGAGQLTIVDGDFYHHKIVADAQGQGTVLLSYTGDSDGKTNAKIDNATFDSIVELATKLYDEKDDHFMELFGNLLDEAKAMPIKEIIDGDYGLLLSTDIIKGLSVTDSVITIDLNGALIGDDELNFRVVIYYNENAIEEVDILNVSFGGKTYDFAFELLEYSEAMHDRYRLVDDGSYLDLSSLSLFLELGLNTSKYNYYHFAGTISVTIMDFIGKDVNADVKILNDKGHVKVLGTLTNIPVIIVVSRDYAVSLKRDAYFMYDNETELFYIYRHDHKNGLLNDIDRKVTLKCDSDYFMENILTIMCRDMLGLSDTIMKRINSTGAGEGQMRYENIVEKYSYDKSQNMFTFGINVGEIARNDDLGSLTLKVFANNKNELNSVDITMEMNPGVPIDLGMVISLQSDTDVSIVNHNITFMDEHVAAHSGDELNRRYE